jgi:DNA processing protein
MTLFGEKESEVATLLTVVARRELNREAVRDHFARALWSSIAEPGDRIAGLAVGLLGAAPALDLVMGKRSATEVAVAMREASAGQNTELTDTDVAKALARWAPRLHPPHAVAGLRRAERVGARLLVPGSPGWPAALSDLELHTPMALWCRGTDVGLAALSHSIALVGARAATGYGEHITMEASAGLVDRGYAIVSGAAYGIDGMAHRAALASHGKTIAFLAGGVDRFYPSGHDALLGRIADTGAVLSELPCGEPPTKWRFLQRNRLIAAASQATVVMEAGWRSGSLNTAGHAATLGRALGAVPGPITSAASAGCHRLIREFDAVCVTTVDEMAELAPAGPADVWLANTESGMLRVPSDPVPDQLRVLDALSSRSPRPSSDVAARSGLAVASVQAALGTLELDGRVVERPRGWLLA